LTLEEAMAAAPGADERVLSDLRREVDEDLEAAVRDPDFRTRALGYRAIGQLHFAQKTELLARGMEDESPACRGSALLSLELLSRGHPGLINSRRPLLHKLVNADPNETVRRLAVLCLKNGSPARDTIVFLDHVTDSDEEKPLRDAAASVLETLKRKSREK
jgi:HEAT repeat protein